MSKWKYLTTLTVLIMAEPLFAINVSQFTNTLNTPTDETARTTIVGIFESCGDTNYMDDDCVIQGLTRVATEENNAYAKAIAKDYETALAEGNYNKPECQVESHAQANRILGHCMLLMNYYAAKNLDNSSAVNQYETCLQGGMQGLVYQGNIVAQSILADLFSQRGLSEAASMWKRGVKMRKDTEEYDSFMKCYGGV